MIGTHGWQDAQRVALGVVQQRGAGYRQVGDTPGAQQVAEIDHALQLPLARGVAGPDRVVVGDVQVHGLDRQLRGERGQMRGCHAGGLFDTRASCRVGQYRQQVVDQRLGVLRVPLQGARQAWVVEAGEGFVQPGAEAAQLGHQVRRHMPEAGQRLAFDVVEQANAQRLAVHVHFQQGLAIIGRAHGWYRQALFAQVSQRCMLGFKLDPCIAAVARLEHVPALGCIDPQVQVLLAAQGRQFAGNSVMGQQQIAGLAWVERRVRQAGTLGQDVNDGGSGRYWLGGHGSTVFAERGRWKIYAGFD